MSSTDCFVSACTIMRALGFRRTNAAHTIPISCRVRIAHLLDKSRFNPRKSNEGLTTTLNGGLLDDSVIDKSRGGGEPRVSATARASAGSKAIDIDNSLRELRRRLLRQVVSNTAG